MGALDKGIAFLKRMGSGNRTNHGNLPGRLLLSWRSGTLWADLLTGGQVDIMEPGESLYVV